MTHDIAVWHAMQFIDMIDEYLSGVTRESFEDDSLRQAAVTLRLQHVSAVTPWIRLELRAAHPEVRWAHIVASDDYYRREFHPARQRVWDDAQEAIGPLRDALLGGQPPPPQPYADSIKRLLASARRQREQPGFVVRSPVVTKDSPGVKYARALATMRKYGIRV